MQELKNHFESLANRANAIPGVVYRGRARNWVLALVADDLQAWLRNAAGHFEVSFSAPANDPELTLTGTAADWLQLFSADPLPGYQTLGAMLLTAKLRLEGDTLLFNQYNLALELIFGALAAVEPPAVVDRPAFIEPVTGTI